MALDTEEYKSEAKICGVLDYNTGIVIGVAMTVLAVIGVLLTVEEYEQYGIYFVVAALNFTCLAVTYVMRKELDKRVA